MNGKARAHQPDVFVSRASGPTLCANILSTLRSTRMPRTKRMLSNVGGSDNGPGPLSCRSSG